MDLPKDVDRTTEIRAATDGIAKRQVIIDALRKHLNMPEDGSIGLPAATVQGINACAD